MARMMPEATGMAGWWTVAARRMADDGLMYEQSFSDGAVALTRADRLSREMRGCVVSVGRMGADGRTVAPSILVPSGIPEWRRRSILGTLHARVTYPGGAS